MTDDGVGELQLTIRAVADAVWLRKRAADYAANLGLSSQQQWEVSIAVSELVTNAVLHAGKGILTVRSITGGLEVVVEDDGAGIDDVAAAFEDGVSDSADSEDNGRGGSGRSLGNGLGAVRRLMDEVDVSRSDRLGGACVVARKWTRRRQ